jgi:hypothetical protein
MIAALRALALRSFCYDTAADLTIMEEARAINRIKNGESFRL